MNRESHDQKVAELPKLSADVYRWLNKEGLYDPGFTDIEVSDIAEGLNIDIDQATGAVGYLVKEELCWVEELQLIREDYPETCRFIQTWLNENTLEIGN